MTDLESLGLRRTRVTGPGLAHLSRMKHLKFLYIDHTPLTDAGLTHLRGMVSLQELRLSRHEDDRRRLGQAWQA